MHRHQLDELEAFDAMILFLRECTRQSNRIQIAELLDEIQYSHMDKSETPILGDQGDWGDWLRAVEAVVNWRGKPRPSVITGYDTPDARED
ncbi:MAG TPA: hypothetical protein VEZ14_05750 [Dehalococcoidia bacterium]|nr:hypothetical protein [Dehalococcoidia bacterium]